MTKTTNKKVDFTAYKDKYNNHLLKMLEESPETIDMETMRTILYGYTFTDDYAQSIIPDELRMDYWSDRAQLLYDEEDTEDFSFDDLIYPEDDYFELNTHQERLIMKAIDSTGDGKTPETALCVIDVNQEYEYLERQFPYSLLRVEKQSYSNGIDCLKFEKNFLDIDCIYFDISRRFEVDKLKKTNNK